MKRYVYETQKGTIISVFAKRQPSLKTIPKRGTWVVNELTYDGWVMPFFPEVTWRTLQQCYFRAVLKQKEVTP